MMFIIISISISISINISNITSIMFMISMCCFVSRIITMSSISSCISIVIRAPDGWAPGEEGPSVYVCVYVYVCVCVCLYVYGYVYVSLSLYVYKYIMIIIIILIV